MNKAINGSDYGFSNVNNSPEVVFFSRIGLRAVGLNISGQRGLKVVFREGGRDVTLSCSALGFVDPPSSQQLPYRYG
jgi:hypothetical protein